LLKLVPSLPPLRLYELAWLLSRGITRSILLALLITVGEETGLSFGIFIGLSGEGAGVFLPLEVLAAVSVILDCTPCFAGILFIIFCTGFDCFLSSAFN